MCDGKEVMLGTLSSVAWALDVITTNVVGGDFIARDLINRMKRT
jgi:hypothetical protein